MPSTRLTVVLSQGQSQNPQKRSLEEDIAAALIMEPGIDVSIVPHLYDLTEDHTGMLFLRSVSGDMLVLSWMYPRAAHWELDRAGVKGRVGTVLLERLEDEDVDEEEPGGDDEAASGAEPKETLGAANVPNRSIYCLDLRDFDTAEPYLTEIRRIAAETRIQTVPFELSTRMGPTLGLPPQGAPVPPSLVPGVATGAAGPTPMSGEAGLVNWIHGSPKPEQFARYLEPQKFLEPTLRRWYPVIDYSRCTNCMECIDFCLFGVYGVDTAERILVEQPDNCRKGCPACSRVCPEHAIIFPMHKTPEIAGSPEVGAGGGLKIDLSKLFGGPNAMEIAAQERDVELIRDGRDAVGLSVGIPKRQAGKAIQPKDDLDRLVDELDSLDL